MNRKAIDLGQTLRAGDPARGETLDPVEVTRLRSRLESALREAAPGSPWPWRAIWAAAALTALALVLGSRAPRHEPAAAAPATVNVKDQQLQFETPDGIRIVWVLSPNVPL